MRVAFAEFRSVLNIWVTFPSIISYALLPAQDLRLSWAKSAGGLYTDYSRSIAVDDSGNVYTTGSFSGSNNDFDPDSGTYILPSNGGSEIFLLKLDKNGQFVWAKSFGSTAADEGFSVVVDHSFNVYLTGYFQFTVDFDPGPAAHYLTSNSGENAFVLKLDAQGKFMWARNIGGSFVDIGISLLIDQSDHLIVTGIYGNTVDFDPDTANTFYLTSNGLSDIFLLKLDTAGTFIHAVSIGGPNYDNPTKTVLADNGDYLVSGSFADTADFDPGSSAFLLPSAGSYDAFIARLSPTLSFKWAKSFGSMKAEAINSVSEGKYHNIYVTGYFEDSVDFDPGPSTTYAHSNGEWDFFLLNLDSAGNFLWVRNFGGSRRDYSTSVTTDFAGNIWLSGQFEQTVDFDPGPAAVSKTSQGGSDVFYLKLDSAGNYLGINTIRSTKDVELGAVYLEDDILYAAGLFETTTDFDPESGYYYLGSMGQTDVFVQKLLLCHEMITVDEIESCDPYTWINGKTYTGSNITASHTVLDAMGCDSIVLLHLTINKIDSGIVTNGNSLQALDSGASYQWFTCDSGLIPLPGATHQNFNPGISGYYLVVLFKNNCSDTSACIYFKYDASSIREYRNGEVDLFPNPNHGNFTIRNFRGVHKSIRIYNSAGIKLFEILDADEDEFSLDLDLKPGSYYVELQQNFGNQIRKLVIF